MTRDEIVEVMAKGAYAKNGWWQVCADDDDGKGRYSMAGYTKLRAVEWGDLDAKERNSRLAEMESILTALEAQGLVVPGWQPIETAPKDGNTILVAVHTDFYGWVRGYARWDGARGIYGWISQGFTDPPGNLGLGNPSHWMPLPESPTERGKDDE